MGKRFDALILDLDDTLWEVGPVIVRAERLLFEYLERHYPRVTARHDIASMRDVRARIALEHPQMRHDFTWLRLESLRAHAAEAGYDASMAEDAFAVFYRARNEVKPYPDVVPALETLSSTYRLYALSNGNADLDAVGLSGYFTLHATARAVGTLKPDRRMFDYVLDAAGLEAARVAHIGDDPDADVGGARGAGLAAVWVNRGGRIWPHAAPAPDHVVADLGELVHWLGG
jgi:2-haloalkanoic acid dehalogenase type II